MANEPVKSGVDHPVFLLDPDVSTKEAAQCPHRFPAKPNPRDPDEDSEIKEKVLTGKAVGKKDQSGTGDHQA